MPTTATRASLRIRSDTGSSAHVGQVLGLAASRQHEIGEQRRPERLGLWQHATWVLDSDLPDTRDLEDHLGRLCDQLADHLPELTQLARDGYHLDWHCYAMIENGQGGTFLGSTLLRRLAAVPADLTLSLYGIHEDETA